MKTEFESKLWDKHHTNPEYPTCGCDVCITFEEYTRPRICRDNIGGINTLKDLEKYLAEFYTQKNDVISTALSYWNEAFEASVDDQQATLIKTLKESDNTSYFLHSVWFQPKTGRFLFNDYHVRYEVIEPLIQLNILEYRGYENHQGEKMLRYALAAHI